MRSLPYVVSAAALTLVACDGLVIDSRGAGPNGWTADPPTAVAGRVTMRRLNRVELNHTVRDLLGLEGDLSRDFPADDRGHGYDNIGDVLSTSALHVELLSKQAEAWVDAALGTADEPGPGRERILTCDVGTDGDSCVRTILQSFVRRAWRRPPTAAEIDRLADLGEVARMHGDGADQGLRLALIATLVSPHFFYRVEIDDGSSAEETPVNDYELASRLSYFLWASTPDDILLDLAEAGTLHEDEVLAAQVERMLDDQRAASLVEDFAGQWLYTRLVPTHSPDPGTFPEWTPELARSAHGQLSRFFGSFLREDRDIRELLTADFGYVDDRLADYYGIEIPDGAERDADGFAEITMPEERRAGILAHAGVLAVNSPPNRTSPVKRGVWVLEQLLCAPPPPPPPGVEGLEASPAQENETLRERFERHRADPVCASCHSVMDPIGFGLERFDGIGRYRELDNGSPIDDTGTLFGEIDFQGATELADGLATDPRFPRCVTRQMMTYALGRGFEHREDAPWIDALTRGMLERGGSFRALIHEIVTSVPFRMRSADHGAEDE